MTEPTRAQAVHERLTVDGRLLPLELRPDRLSQFGASPMRGALLASMNASISASVATVTFALTSASSSADTVIFSFDASAVSRRSRSGCRAGAFSACRSVPPAARSAARRPSRFRRR